MVQIVYMPLPHDFDETEIAGVKFKAFEPTEVRDSRTVLIARLLGNPWFAKPEDVPAERKAKWKAVRDAQAMAAQHRAFADKVEAEAEAKAEGKLVEQPAAAAPPAAEASDQQTTVH